MRILKLFLTCHSHSQSKVTLPFMNFNQILFSSFLYLVKLTFIWSFCQNSRSKQNNYFWYQYKVPRIEKILVSRITLNKELDKSERQLATVYHHHYSWIFYFKMLNLFHYLYLRCTYLAICYWRFYNKLNTRNPRVVCCWPGLVILRLITRYGTNPQLTLIWPNVAQF